MAKLKLGRYYPIAIVLISFALLSIRLFQSDGIVGNDIHTEYESYRLFVDKGIWINDIPLIGRCLGISIIPGLIEKALGTVGTPLEPFIYKLIFAIISSFTPLVVYFISRRYLNYGYSLLASLFVPIQITYLSTVIYARSSLGLFVFSLAVLFYLGVNNKRNHAGFILTLLLLPFIHYTTLYIALFLFLVTSLIRWRTHWVHAILNIPVIVVSFMWLDIARVIRMNNIGMSDIFRLLASGQVNAKIIISPNATATASRVSNSGVLATKNSMLHLLFGIGITEWTQWVNLVAIWLSFGLIALGVWKTLQQNRTLGVMGLLSGLLLLLMVIVPYWSVWYSPLLLFTQLSVILSIALIQGAERIARLVRIPVVAIYGLFWLPLAFFNILATTIPIS